MTSLPIPSIADAAVRRLKRRRAADRRFRLIAHGALIMALGLLAGLIVSITVQALPAFSRTELALTLSPQQQNDPAVTARTVLRGLFPAVTERAERRALGKLVSIASLRPAPDGDSVGDETVWTPLSASADAFYRGTAGKGRLSEKQRQWINDLDAMGRLRVVTDWGFFTRSDSREPELAGIRAATIGSALTLLITLLLAGPLGILAAVWLEEFAPKNRWTDAIEITINNLAAVPSIVFGLLGLAVLLSVFNIPRSTPLVGGMVLALMSLPVIIIATRAALKAVPPSIRAAALAVGASPFQVVAHHVLPLAAPGVLTGTIIAMAQALGETAPLLMIGMVAFIATPPDSFTDPATVLPVQIFLWAASPERAFAAKTAAAILVLLAFLVSMNSLAIYLRYRVERRR